MTEEVTLANSSEIITGEDRWTLFDAMFKELGLVRQHLYSYNDFIETGLNKIVQEMGRIEPDVEGYYVKLEGIEIGEPSIREADGSERPIYPMEARIRNLIYSVPLYLLMRPVFIEDGIEQQEEPVRAYIGRLPTMLKSKICPLSTMSREELVRHGEDPEDPGGYFIINGSERVIVTQEYLVSNRVLVDYGRKGGPVSAVAKVFSTVAGFRSLVTVERRKDGRLSVNFFSVPRPLPFAVLMKALGVSVDREIAQMVSYEKWPHWLAVNFEIFLQSCRNKISAIYDRYEKATIPPKQRKTALYPWKTPILKAVDWKKDVLITSSAIPFISRLSISIILIMYGIPTISIIPYGLFEK